MTRADLVPAARDEDTELIAELRRRIAELEGQAEHVAACGDVEEAAWARELAAAQEHAANLERTVATLRTEVERMRPVFDAAVEWGCGRGTIGAVLDAVADLEGE